MGSRIGADNAVMHVYDASRDPVEIRANWTLADDQTSTAAYTGADGDGLNVTLVCLGEHFSFFLLQKLTNYHRPFGKSVSKLG